MAARVDDGGVMTTASPVGNVADLLRHAAAEHGSRAALISDDRTITWAELDTAADNGAAAFAAAGAAPGDRVLVALPTGAELAAALFAIARAGLVAVPVDPARTDTARIAQLVGAIGGVAVGQEHGSRIAVTPAEIAGWWAPALARVPFANRAEGEDLALLARASRADRAVMVSHRAMLAAAASIGSIERLSLRPDDRSLLVLPLYHLAGLVTAFLPLAAAGAAAVIPADSTADAALTAIRAHRVTVVPGAPVLYHELRSTPGAERALASVRLMTSGAYPLDPEDFSAMKSLTGQPVWEGYGISEACAAVASSLMADVPRAGSVGLAIPGVELQILHGETVETPDEEPAEADATAEADETAEATADSTEAESDEAGSDEAGLGEAESEPADSHTAEEAPEAEEAHASEEPGVTELETLAEVSGVGEVGPIAIRGDMLFSGYWPDGSGGPDANGWFVTGDVGYTDDAGRLHLVDRVAETVQIAGFTVYPREVEQVLADHPYVAEAAVIGIPDRGRRALVAVLVARPGTRPTESDLTEYLHDRLPTYKRPTAYELVAALPRTELGRLDRQAVLQGYADAHGIDVAATLLAAVDAPVDPPVEASEPLPAPHESVDGEAPESAVDQTEADRTTGPDLEPAADLSELGTKLPATGARADRVAEDTDDDLF